jgi:hypothetical protein
MSAALSVLHRDVADHGAHDLGRPARGVQFDQRRQAVLRQKLLALKGIGRPHARAEDRPVVVEPHPEQPVEVPGLMRAVEIAESDVDDAGGEARPVVVRHPD